MQYPESYQKLLKQFLKFPTVGPRTAARFISYLMHESKDNLDQLINSIQELKNKIKFCEFCFSPFEGEEKLCEICRNKSRDQNLLCIVEKETDFFSIEKTKKYKGLYFILGGTVSTFKKRDVEKIRIDELKERIKNPKNFGIETSGFNEVIIATNLTTEGEATASLIERTLKKTSPSLKITMLGRGLPKGGELEYADEETLSAAFESRR